MSQLIEAFDPRVQDTLPLRFHRASSVILTNEEIVEIRAAQRTFEGAYTRTALGHFFFSLVILKIFHTDFYPVGALFAAYGLLVLLVATYRRYESNRQFFVDAADGAKKFRTSGNSVALLAGLSLGVYLVLILLVWRLGD